MIIRRYKGMMTKTFVFFLIFIFSSKSSAQPFVLGNVCQNMWDKAALGNSLRVPFDVKVDTVRTNPLFTLEPAGKAKVASNVFQTFKALLTTINAQNMNAFLNVITQPGGPVEQALNYLNAHVFQPTKNMAQFKAMLEDAWFKPLPGKGFKHVFVGEKARRGQYSGFHNWYQFYLQQSQNKISNVQVASFTYNTEPNLIAMKFDWDQATKRSPSSLFVGTSPTFDFALFSVCFFALYGPNRGQLGNECTCKIHKSTLTLKAIEKPPRSVKICTVYPMTVVADAVCTSFPYTARTDCGWLGIDDYNCAKRGCCFDSQPHGGHVYWCFYPQGHKCFGIPPKKRKDCGYPGISREKCEIANKCCFDENFGEGVPHCFKGNP